MKAANYLLGFCGLILLAHLVMTVVSERTFQSRQAFTPQGQAGVKLLALNLSDPYLLGGNPANSALVLNFSRQDRPPTTDSRLSDVYFDFPADGRAVRTGWIGLGSGFLALDRQNTGQVRDGSQLFGNRTLKGREAGLTGFEVLARLDDNRDGRIDPQDAVWPFLRVWRDIYRDGQVRRGALETLDELGISSLSLAAEPLDTVLNNGNFLRSESGFSFADGRQGVMAEIYFQERSSDRRFPAGPSAEDRSVPRIPGSGLVRDLQEAAALNPDLKRLVRLYSEQTDRERREALVDELLTAWADTSGLRPTVEERAGDRYQVIPAGSQAAWEVTERLLHVLSAFNGRYYFLLPEELGPGQELSPSWVFSGPDEKNLALELAPRQIDGLIRAYQALKNRVKAGLDGEYRFASPLDLWRREPDQVKAGFDRLFESSPEAALQEVMDFRLVLAVAELSGLELDDYLREKIALHGWPSPEMQRQGQELEKTVERTEKALKARSARAGNFKWGLDGPR